MVKLMVKQVASASCRMLLIASESHLILATLPSNPEAGPSLPEAGLSDPEAGFFPPSELGPEAGPEQEEGGEVRHAALRAVRRVEEGYDPPPYEGS